MILLGSDSPQPLDRELVGGKAASISTMLHLGLPVPPAFVLPTTVCRAYYAADRELPAHVHDDLSAGVVAIEHATGRRLGDTQSPLLVSVRSGAAASMPGMMDTVLNLGVNDEVAAALAARSGDMRFATETHRRFRDQFSQIVGTTPPRDPWRQLELAVAAVFESWWSPRAVAYRRHRGLSDDVGTAVTVQAMVFGNLDRQSGTGVLFSRSPVTGDPAPYGEWLPCGQGEDVVSGTRDPHTLVDLATSMPTVHQQLLDAAGVLERQYRDIQDIEFTVECGRLWLLQARAAKRSPRAALRHAVAMCREGILRPEEAVSRVSPAELRQLLRPQLAAEARASTTVLARGEIACPGIATGLVVTSADRAEQQAEAGVDVILAAETTTPDDVHGMVAARATITEIGGATSHAAVVSRELGRPCLVGCGAGSVTTLEGRNVTVDGTTGEVLDGILETHAPADSADPDLAAFTRWARHDASDASSDLLAVLDGRTDPVGLCEEAT